MGMSLVIAIALKTHPIHANIVPMASTLLSTVLQHASNALQVRGLLMESTASNALPENIFLIHMQLHVLCVLLEEQVRKAQQLVHLAIKVKLLHRHLHHVFRVLQVLMN